jgi:MOSC domain-containing protein YiiM
LSTPRVIQINLSNGGVPKTPVPRARVTREGLEGDHQADRKHHGGPERAVSLFSIEIIERLRAQGHPIAPGTTGENLTIEGLEWTTLNPGARLRFTGGVELEIASYANPCATIRESFADLDSKRIKQDLHPGESRLYARVIAPGEIEAGERIERIA